MTRTPPNYSRPCRSKQHTIPAGVMGCRECNKLTNRTPRWNKAGTPRKGIPQPARLPRLLGSIPPDAVLNDAACSPETAELFDPVVYDGSHARGTPEWPRIERAKAICQGCPVIAACYADAVENKRLGVYGGAYLSPKWYEKRRSKAVVQKMKSP